MAVAGRPASPQLSTTWPTDFPKRCWVGISVKYRLTNKRHPGTSPFDAVKDARSAVRYVRAHAADVGIDPGRLVVNGVKPGLPPTLLLHGETDTVTPFAGAKLFHERMLAAKNDCALITGGGGHGYFTYKQNRLDEALAQVDRWLNAHGYAD